MDYNGLREVVIKKMKMLHMVAFALLAVGGLNWGLVGLFGFNLVSAVLGPVENLVYILVGASAVYIGATHMKDCKICSSK